MRSKLILKLISEEKLKPVEESSRSSIKDLPLKPIRCTSCNKFIDYTEEGNVIFLCPVCRESIIVRCKKCRRIGRRVKCPTCGTEYP
ncbi:MAG: zinc finger domain-containing protein [Crenarchaeota archaeon]|nr:zinc finger domain-containing protein [Thermoproteota archaeon]MCR8454220.1 zinc finger domain-containing protein [Thermoproteota archaeon]MCR8454732.1 zinc finger domain-containing protein [Thermoproteota archaeon]MCR8463406.1 zinc finger domain-containing protein [Thermoproteota archaeon]MCR8470243.1 zinc finger domain-containing protein [Thermoproteota archaeon]